jgi:hypothetical protein
MELGTASRFGTVLKVVGIIGGLIVAARMYVALLPRSPALGALLVVGTGAALAFAFLQVDRRLEEIREERAAAVEPPPGYEIT